MEMKYSPYWKNLRKEAFKYLKVQADCIRIQVNTKNRDVDIGDIVQILIKNTENSKANTRNITFIITKKVS